MATFAIRDATVADVPALARLATETHALHAEAEPDVYRPFDDPDAVERWLREYLGDEDAFGWIAEQDGQAVAYGLARLRTNDESLFVRARRVLHVDSVGVTAAARRSGIGRALMQEVGARAAVLEAAAVELDVRGFNEDAQRFYRALGYREARLTMTLLTPRGGAGARSRSRPR